MILGASLLAKLAVSRSTVLSGLNRMIDDAAQGRAVFYPFYSETQVRQDPAKAETG